MKSKKLLYLSIILFSVLFAQCQTLTQKNYSKVKINSELDSVSYYLGTLWGRQAVANKVTSLDYESLLKGFEEVFKNDSTIPPEHVVSMFLNKYVGKQFEKETREKNKEYIEKNIKFLEDNKKKDGVITLSSGLQYIVLTEGNGPRPAENDQVKVHYKGTLIDDTQFDSSYDRGEPAVFGASGLIKGFTEAILLMPVGSKWKIFIPENLAYGANSQPPIHPFSTLIFEIELLEIMNSDVQEELNFD